MTGNLTTTRRLGVFATKDGWLLTDADRREWFDDWNDAVNTALRRAHVARWRGADAEVVAQDHSGGSLIVIESTERQTLPSPQRGIG
jgi:hypothetical protein